MYELIKTKPVFFPDAKKHGISMSDNCKAFISACLEKNPTKRLGKNGIEDITSHAWFDDINKADLLEKKIQPEFKPKLSANIMDVSNFDKMFTSNEAVISVMPQQTVDLIKQ